MYSYILSSIKTEKMTENLSKYLKIQGKNQ